MYSERYVKLAIETAELMGMTLIEFASKVWPEKTKEAANTTIHALKNLNSRGKQQNLRVSDAVRMAEVLGREYPSFCFEVWEKLRLETQPGKAISPKTKEKAKKESLVVQ